jgi:hypothetical protein
MIVSDRNLSDNEIMGNGILAGSLMHESQAKYVNTPETIVYHKSKILYGIDKAKQRLKVKIPFCW